MPTAAPHYVSEMTLWRSRALELTEGAYDQSKGRTFEFIGTETKTAEASLHQILAHSFTGYGRDGCRL